MPEEMRTSFCIVTGLVIFLLICCVSMVSAVQSNGTVALNTPTGYDQGNGTVIADATVTVTTTLPAIQAKALTPIVQRKISTNLLYIIDSNTPSNALSRSAVQKQMETEGKLRSGKQQEQTEKRGERAAAAAEPAANLVLVYIDLVPTAPTSVIDSFVSSITERNEQDHSVVAWVDINNLETLASLDAVSNIRTAEPSVTKNSPVYRDTKFVNKRAGKPPATVDEAKASVRDFEQAPGLALEQKRTMKTPRGDVYDISSDSGRYFVNAKTGEVELAFYPSKSKLSSNRLEKSTSIRPSVGQIAGTITMDQAFAIAQDFVSQNNLNFFKRTMILTRSKLIDHGDAGKVYSFTWIEKINDVFTPNAITVFINQENGNIISYIGTADTPVNVNIVPLISKVDAISRAVAVFSPIDVETTDAVLFISPVNEYDQNLVWDVSVIGRPKDFIEQGGDVYIDAHSGSIIGVSRFS